VLCLSWAELAHANQPKSFVLSESNRLVITTNSCEQNGQINGDKYKDIRWRCKCNGLWNSSGNIVLIVILLTHIQDIIRYDTVIQRLDNTVSSTTDIIMLLWHRHMWKTVRNDVILVLKPCVLHLTPFTLKFNRISLAPKFKHTSSNECIECSD
jgi:hypothetical protein